MSKQLATIVTEAPFSIDIEDCKYSTFNKGQVKEVLEKYNFKSLIRRLGFEVDGGTKSSSKGSALAENQMSLF